MYDVFGIGNPLVDLIVAGDDELLRKIGFQKGSMNLVDKNKFKEVIKAIENYDKKRSCGDSTANTLVGLSLLGNKTVFSGKIGRDEDGRFYENELTSYGVTTNIAQDDEETGNCISIVTEDTERTMCVYLGACVNLQKNDIKIDNLKKSKIFHFTAYQLDSPSLKEASLYAFDIAKLNDIKVSFDLADVNVIERHRKLIEKILSDTKVVFSNSEEARVFTYEKDPEMAAKFLSKYADIAVVKDGKNGSYVYSNGELVHVPAFSVKAIDTTGAGDGYASGFLKGLLDGYSIAKTAEIGSYFASEVVKIYGSRLSLDKKLEIQAKISELLDA